MHILPLIAAFLIHFCLMTVQSYTAGDESLGKLKVTHLHFYLQDFVTGNNPTAFKVAGTNISSPILFGDVFVADDALTEGIERNSTVIGNAQGIYAFTGKDRISAYVTMDFGFTTGKYNGSSISVASRNMLAETTRELAVVGGRGQFQFAWGFALITTRFFQDLNAVVEYNVTVLHY